MRQLTCTAPMAVEWREVSAPDLLEPTDALVRPIAVARCDIDPLLLLGGPGALDGYALGHEAVAEVVALGDDVEGLVVGQRVLPAFQVSCGTCPTCRRGRTAACEQVPLLSDYGMATLSGTERGGMLSDLVRVPWATGMLTPLPDGLDPVAVASVPDNVVDGYRAVAPHLAARPGADVLVVEHGTPSISLYAAQSALALGATSVTVASGDEAVLAAAEHVGAQPLPSDLATRVGRWPVVVNGGTSPEGLLWALDATAPEGTLHSVAYAVEDPALPLAKLYTKGIDLHIGRAHSAALIPEVIALVAEGRLHPEAVTTAVVDWEDAPERFAEPGIKLVVARAG